MEFKHERLSRGEIRLFRARLARTAAPVGIIGRLLKKGNTTSPADNSLIVLEFKHGSLSALHRSYDAISYCWETPVRDQAVWSNGKKMLVTSSAAKILYRTAKSGLDTWYWMDQLCLDQGNNEEKAWSIRLMGDIYASADLTCGIPGPDPAKTQMALWTIRKLYLEFRGTTNYRLEDISSAAGVDLLSPQFDAVFDLLKSPWLSRVWVAQEIYRSRNMQIIGESIYIDWPIFSDFLAIFASRWLTETFGDKDQDGKVRNGLLAAESISLIRSKQLKGFPDDKWALQDLLVELSLFQSYEAPDKLFAPLSMADDAKDTEFSPDYASPIEELYKRYTKHLVVRDQNIRLLHIAGLAWGPQSKALPSWVPDLDRAPPARYLLERRQGMAGYRAGGEGGMSISVSYDTLKISGIILDTVSHVDRTKPEFKEWPPVFDIARASKQMAWFDTILTLFQSLAPYPTGEDVIDAMWRTLVGNVDNYFQPVGLEYRKYFEALLKWLRASLEGDQAEANLHASDASRFTNTVGDLAEKVILITEKRYAGHASSGVVVGDVVCIFVGDGTPFLLRPVDDDIGDGEGNRLYHLVAECYVHGLMAGEGLQCGTHGVQDINIA